MDDRTVREQVARVEQALAAIEALPGGPRETALEAIGLLVDLYGEGWARTLAHVDQACPGAAASLAGDELVGHLLMIHDLHPEGVEGRVRAALAELEGAVNADGLRVELVSLEETAVRLRLGDNGHAPAPGFRDLLEQTVLQAAPELERVELETPTGGAGNGGGPALVQLRRGGGRDAKGSGAREGS